MKVCPFEDRTRLRLHDQSSLDFSPHPYIAMRSLCNVRAAPPQCACRATGSFATTVERGRSARERGTVESRAPSKCLALASRRGADFAAATLPQCRSSLTSTGTPRAQIHGRSPKERLAYRTARGFRLRSPAFRRFAHEQTPTRVPFLPTRRSPAPAAPPHPHGARRLGLGLRLQRGHRA